MFVGAFDEREQRLFVLGMRRRIADHEQHAVLLYQRAQQLVIDQPIGEAPQVKTNVGLKFKDQHEQQCQLACCF